MSYSFKRHSPLAVLLFLAACGLTRCQAGPLDQAAYDALYADPQPVAPGPQRVFHLGHSLVGRDMPAMLAQLTDATQGPGHSYNSQLGWGATLKSHWEPDEPVNGLAEENSPPQYRDAREAVGSGDYDALVLTEMVEIRDAIKYHATPDYLHRWALAAWEANPATRVYLYETWHALDDPEGWMTRLDRDLGLYWEGEILRRALAREGMNRPIHVIPAGQVMAAFLRAVEARGGVEGIAGPESLFSDTIHFNDLGAYLVALTHYAVLYQRSPVGLPHALRRADGSPADAPSPEAAALMQEVVWEVVRGFGRTGVP